MTATSHRHLDIDFVIGGGSSKGVTLAAEGKMMIGMASRDLWNKEKKGMDKNPCR